ncbi:MAG: glycosyltransferase [Bacteroidetes bacterium]|nr:glycosyltransferase [Bacteroidota bacterium]MCL1968103.1 glycosyltransferase [Bacteroidota bacterium]
MTDLYFSIIITVYNTPDEVIEFLNSLTTQTDLNFDVIVVEDSLQAPCKKVCEQYAGKLNIAYYFVPPSGRSEKRNFAMQHAQGNYFIIFDTDCIVPPRYFEIVRKKLTSDYVDCYGGPDNADQSFSNTQKAINFAMTSLMTTGGIRGNTYKVEKFFPRSFNMGMSKQVFETVGGFRNVIGEDLDLSIRIKNAGFRVMLFKDAFVFHKRKLDLKKFLKQVTTFGKARVLLSRLHPGSLKLIHLFPACFALGNVALLLLSLILFNPLPLLPIGIFVLALFLESLFKNKKINIALMSILTSYIQLFGYGFGFLSEWITKKASKVTQEELYG